MRVGATQRRWPASLSTRRRSTPPPQDQRLSLWKLIRCGLCLRQSWLGVWDSNQALTPVSSWIATLGGWSSLVGQGGRKHPPGDGLGQAPPDSTAPGSIPSRSFTAIHSFCLRPRRGAPTHAWARASCEISAWPLATASSAVADSFTAKASLRRHESTHAFSVGEPDLL
jgi:hypothetical protein